MLLEHKKYSYLTLVLLRKKIFSGESKRPKGSADTLQLRKGELMELYDDLSPNTELYS